MPESSGRSRPLSQDLADAALEMAAILSTKRAARAPVSPAVSDLVYRGLRGWGLAQVRLARMAPKLPQPQISALLAIAWAALHEEMRAPYVIVDETVAAAKRIAGGKTGSNKNRKANSPDAVAGFVNALLRQSMAQAELAANDVLDPQARWNAPLWWIEKIQHDWLGEAPSMLDALASKGPLTVRLHARTGGSVADYLERLERCGLKGIQVGPRALAIEPAVPVQKIPGFDDGKVSVQDAAAQNICGIFDALAQDNSWSQKSTHILDACAAPGGKSIALAESYPATVWAMDASPQRLAALNRDLPRVALGLAGQIKPVVADVLDPATWPGQMPQAFDAIVLDAPCSASGVTRRHPEIPWRRSQQAIADVADIQRQMLDVLWGRLKPGGELAFVTCSVFRDEGECQQQAFLGRHADAALLPSPGRVWPCDDSLLSRSQDGFFFALFKKTKQ